MKIFTRSLLAMSALALLAPTVRAGSFAGGDASPKASLIVAAVDTSVPEPGTLTLLAIGTLALFARRR